ALLRQVCDRPGTDPVFWWEYAQELAPDAREHAVAMRLLRRAIRFRPLEAGAFATLANVHWDRRRWQEALELYRFAACLNDKDEGLARSCFIASRHLKQDATTLHFLRKRFERFGAVSSWPARTLHWAYGQLGRLGEASDLLEKALARRPNDGDLRL